jgi:hypothetical protein
VAPLHVGPPFSGFSGIVSMPDETSATLIVTLLPLQD